MQSSSLLDFMRNDTAVYQEESKRNKIETGN